MTTSDKSTSAIIIMGVSGTGKSTIGKLSAERLGLPFFDGDDYHSEANVAKMTRGEALNDEDRAGWLQTLCLLIQAQNILGRSPVIACSALKQAYRDTLRSAAEAVHIIHLAGSRDLIARRMEQRAKETKHFMKTAMLDSQLATLEDPSGEVATLTLDIQKTPKALSESIYQYLSPKIS